MYAQHSSQSVSSQNSEHSYITHEVAWCRVYYRCFSVFFSNNFTSVQHSIISFPYSLAELVPRSQSETVRVSNNGKNERFTSWSLQGLGPVSCWWLQFSSLKPQAKTSKITLSCSSVDPSVWTISLILLLWRNMLWRRRTIWTYHQCSRKFNLQQQQQVQKLSQD